MADITPRDALSDKKVKRAARYRYRPASDAWWRAAGELARQYCPEIKACRECNAPVVSGYCCTHCESTNP